MQTKNLDWMIYVKIHSTSNRIEFKVDKKEYSKIKIKTL